MSHHRIKTMWKRDTEKMNEMEILGWNNQSQRKSANWTINKAYSLMSIHESCLPIHCYQHWNAYVFVHWIVHQSLVLKCWHWLLWLFVAIFAVFDCHLMDSLRNRKNISLILCARFDSFYLGKKQMNVQHSFNITVNTECLLIQIHCSMTMTQFILQQKCKIKEHYN